MLINRNSLPPIRKRQTNNSGDTIVEVLIAIAIAAFAIGTSYAIANRSLQQAITARERNQALNITQNQIAALKIRFINDKSAFNSNDPTKGFVVPSTTPTPPVSQLPYTDFHFCLDDQSASPTDSSHPWARQAEDSTFTDVTADNISTTNVYKPICVRNNSSTDFFIDISAQITDSSKNSVNNRTVYKIAVRWNQVGGGTAESNVYYRL